MKKAPLLLALAILTVAIYISSAKAWMQADINVLNVDVSCAPEVIAPGQKVEITVTANMDGKGTVLVIQPVEGSSVASSESAEVQMDLSKISSDRDASFGRIVSYALVGITDLNGGKQEFTFPDDFTGLNGKPNTETGGKYYVFFVFLHLCVCKFDFDCASFFVIPEVPFGTLGFAGASFGTLLGYVAIKKRHAERHFTRF